MDTTLAETAIGSLSTATSVFVPTGQILTLAGSAAERHQAIVALARQTWDLSRMASRTQNDLPEAHGMAAASRRPAPKSKQIVPAGPADLARPAHLDVVGEDPGRLGHC